MIRPKVQIKGNFRATEKLRAAFKRANGSHFTLGVHADAGQYPATPEQPDPPTAGEVAWWLEKGTKRMPARPFMDPAISENLDSIRRKMALGLTGIAYQGWTVAKGLTVPAVHMLWLVQNKVKSNVGPALSGSWDPPKGYLGWKRENGMGQRTLIATGLMYRSLAYKLFLSTGAELEAARAAQASAPPDAREPALDAAAERARARAEGKAQKEQWRAQRQAHAGRDIFGPLTRKGTQSDSKATAGKAHQAARARRGKYRGK